MKSNDGMDEIRTVIDRQLRNMPVFLLPKNHCVRFTVLGQCVSMKNSKIVRRNGFPIKPAKQRKFETDFLYQVPLHYRNLKLGGPTEPLRAVLTIFYPSFKQDVDPAIVFDCLQNAGVISNDRYVREMHVYGEVDPKQPRVEIILEPI